MIVLVEPILRIPLLQHVLQRGQAHGEQRNARPVHRTACRVLPGGSLRKVLTRKVDAMPIGMLMKKHQCHW